MEKGTFTNSVSGSILLQANNKGNFKSVFIFEKTSPAAEVP
jgi:hypothetical protein